MSTGTTLAVAALGGLGATARFVAEGLPGRHRELRFAAATLAVNLSGAFALGVIVGVVASADTTRVLGTGFLGGYTTFSGWMLEVSELDQDGHRRTAIALALGSLVAGVMLAWVGRSLGADL
jgi:CrcB protein